MRKKNVTTLRITKRGDKESMLVVDNLSPEKGQQLFAHLCRLGVAAKMAVVIPGKYTRSGKFQLNISHDGGSDKEVIDQVVNLLKQTGVMAVTSRTTRKGKAPSYTNNHRH